MLHGNIKGFMLGGLAAYLIIGKGFNTVNRTIDRVCDTLKWRSYYRHGKDGNMVPPGYASHTRRINNDEEYVVENGKQQKHDASAESVGSALAKAITAAINDKLKGSEAAEEASEGQTEASESDICTSAEENANKPTDYVDYVAFKDYYEKCTMKGMSDKEIALSLGMSVDELNDNLEKADEFIMNQESEDILHADDLRDGFRSINTKTNEDVTEDE